MLFGELLADWQPVAPAANKVLALGGLVLEFGAVAAAKATAVVVASDGADNDVTVIESCNSDAFGGNSK